MSPDPIGPAGGANLYGYALGNPIGAADRSGLDPCVPSGNVNISGSTNPTFQYQFNPMQGCNGPYTGGELAAAEEGYSNGLSNQTSVTTLTYPDGTTITVTRTPDGAVTTATAIAGQTTTEHSGGCTQGARGVACSTQISVTAPRAAVSPFGLTFDASVRVYSSPAFGLLGRPLGLNHAFVYSEGTGRGKGMEGSSWVTTGDGVGDLDSPYVLARLPPGLSEEEFMDRIELADGWNNGVWCPFGNDCHSEVEDAFRQAGVRYPGAPNGRMDIDDNFWAAALRIARRYAYPWWGW